jgi:type IV pilus assembly protein PilF
VFTIDDRLRGLPASREQVVALYQSINSPHLAVPGKQAGPAQAFILGLRGGSGFAVFVYLYLAEAGDCAIYVPERRNLSPDEYADEEGEGLAFVESMGFMMDNMNFRSLSAEDQEQMLKTAPVFQKDPRGASGAGGGKGGKPEQRNLAAIQLGKLFASFCLVLAVLGGCKHMPTEKEQQGAQIHYDLGVQAQQADPQTAFKEFEAALELDPYMVEAHNASGVLLHLSFGRQDEAIAHYRKALELRPDFTETKVNLANVFLDQKRYDEAIKLYEEALNDMLYRTPDFAHGNLGWALYKKGELRKAIESIRAALTINPKFCLGYKNLGIIYDEGGSTDEACKQFGRYRENCPEVADAHYREGVCLAKQGQTVLARQSFESCQAKATSDVLKDDCQKLKESMGP